MKWKFTFMPMLAVLSFSSLFELEAQAATRSVCPSGCSYSLPSQAYAAASDGDTIEIQPGTYTDCIYIQKNNLTITGVNGRPKMINSVCGGKGILVTAGQNLTIRNLELSGATNNDNYAGIRHDAAGFNLTLDNVYIHDNDDGILASSSGDTITITNSKFENNGMNSGNGYAHNLYIGNAALVTFQNSQSLSAKLQGHEFKSRAARTEIYSSTLATLGGADSRLIDLSNGGTLIVQNSVLEKSSTSDNNEMIAFAPEGVGSNRTNSVTITGNIIIGDRNPTDLIYYYNVTPPMNISNNILVAIRTITNAGSAGSNTSYSSRSAAGYPAYPWLPSPGGVVNTTTTTTTTTMPPTTTTMPPTTTTTLASSSSWIRCANEGGVCYFSGTRTVRYGANGSYVTKVATSSINCDNATFGDPAYGIAKACDYSADAISTPTTTTTVPTNTSSSWTYCSGEGSTCSFSGTRDVRFGANGSYIYKSAVTGSVPCTNDYFGSDPAYGTFKTCEYSNTTSSTPPVLSSTTWTNCSSEWGTCFVSGTRQVRYGANGSYVTKVVTGSIACTNDAFGTDPAVGVVKSCEYSSDTTTSTTPTTTAWTFCANEWGTCYVSGTHQVRYGANGSYIFKTVTGSIACTNDAFGTDPAYGIVKSCEYQ